MASFRNNLAGVKLVRDGANALGRRHHIHRAGAIALRKELVVEANENYIVVRVTGTSYAAHITGRVRLNFALPTCPCVTIIAHQ